MFALFWRSRGHRAKEGASTMVELPYDGFLRMFLWERQLHALLVKFLAEHTNQRGVNSLDVCTFRCTDSSLIPGLKASLIQIGGLKFPYWNWYDLDPIPAPGQCFNAFLLTESNPYQTWGYPGGRSHRMLMQIFDPQTGLRRLTESFQIQFPFDVEKVYLRGQWCFEGPAPRGMSI